MPHAKILSEVSIPCPSSNKPHSASFNLFILDEVAFLESQKGKDRLAFLFLSVCLFTFLVLTRGGNKHVGLVWLWLLGSLGSEKYLALTKCEPHIGGRAGVFPCSSRSPHMLTVAEVRLFLDRGSARKSIFLFPKPPKKSS